MNQDPGSPVASVTTSTAPLGDLLEVFRRREIAVGVDAHGNHILARPRSVLVDSQGDTRRLRSLVKAARDARPKSRSSREPTEVAGVVMFDVPVDTPPEDGPEAIWRIEPASATVARLNASDGPAMLNSVFFGAPGSFTGNPLGVGASYAGDLPFSGEAVTLGNGRKVLLSTAQPHEALTLPQALNLPKRSRPCVLVLDTGLRTSATSRGVRHPEHPDLRDCKVHGDWRTDAGIDATDDEDEADADGNDVLDFEAGHGTFISGLVRQVCPDAIVYTTGVLSSFGDGSIWSVLKGLRRILDIMAVDGAAPDVVVMSFGGYLPLDEAGFLGAAFKRMLGDAVIVAAAGNDATCRPHFPAALHDVVGVGGLASAGKAWFSNFGGWVDACAPAVDVVSTFFTDFTEVVGGKPTRRYEGWARWSGTSFAAPKVAAAIAQEQYLRNSSARDAWTRLSSYQNYRYPDLGIVFNV
jgi:hypothetical protein